MQSGSIDRHGAQDMQSMLMHREAVRLLIEDPTLVRRVEETLIRWRLREDPNSAPLLTRWEQIVSNRDWSAAIAETEEGQQLRQASPLPTLLPEESRLAIILHVKTLKTREPSPDACPSPAVMDAYFLRPSGTRGN